MKKALVVCICFLFVQKTQASVDTLAVSEKKEGNQMEVSLDMSAFPFGGGGDWEFLRSVRIGIGKHFDQISAYGYLDYYYFKFVSGGGLTNHFTPESYSARRFDIAVYGGAKFFKIVTIGLGLFYTKSDAVSYFLSSGVPYQVGGDTKVHFFYTIGAGYDISLSDRLFIPMNMYFRDPKLNSTVFVAVKIGIGMRF
ncbi:MAG: hypothetical protein HY089_00650 [Ignavibacteriales bacterium]|nr:hypothetical protein [Ignavibacteriales bacterium]